MDQDFVADATLGAETINGPTVESTSGPYLGRWNHLVSTTNWEKGHIICQWREALAAVGAPDQSASDEAWSRRVGDLTPQHCGRLRRVWQKFGQVREQYAGLYWSHFQAALEWSDAEMWLEGAVQNGWSIAQMRQHRSDTLDALDPAPESDEGPVEVWDDGVPVGQEPPPETISSSLGEVHEAAGDGAMDETAIDEEAAGAEDFSAEPVRPFEGLPPLPADVDAAFEAFKLAIVRHRQAGWAEISCPQVLAVLDALRQFAQQPAEL